jgi:hypothetical protein
MGYLESLMSQNEKVVLVTRQHWFVLVSAILVMLLLFLGLVAVGVALLFRPFVGPAIGIVFILLAILPLIRGIRDFVLHKEEGFIAVLRNIAGEIGAIVVLVLLGLAMIVAVRVGPRVGIGVLLLSLIPLARVIYDFLVWYNEQYVITNRRVIQTKGIINKSVIDSSLEKVNDVVMNQSVLGRFFDYGNLEILTASEIGVNQLKRIRGPVRFKTEMLNQKQALGYLEAHEGEARPTMAQKTPTPADIPTLIAKLEELRKQGVLTDEEFERKKAELLAKM